MDGSADDISDWRARMVRALGETRERADGVAQFHRDVARIARSVEKIAATMAGKATVVPAAPVPVKVWTGLRLNGERCHILIVDLGADVIVGFDDKGNMFEGYTDLVQIGHGAPWIQVTTDRALVEHRSDFAYRRENIARKLFHGAVDPMTLIDSDGKPF